MKKEMLTANKAIAYGGMLCRPDFVPTFPITPQTEIIEVLSKWIAQGKFKTRFLPMDSEHSVMSAAVAASAVGTRVFTATSSQGLMLMAEMLPIASGLRTPLVLANVSRALAAPIALGPDNNDVLAMRDFGFLQFHCETAQECLDMVPIAFKVSEDERVILPSIVNEDGFVLSFTREPVEIPEQKEIDDFLPERELPYPISKQPIMIHPAVLEGELYTFYRNQIHLAMQNSVEVISEVFREFGKKLGRKYDFIEEFMMKDAEIALVTFDSITTQAKAAVRKLREIGEKVGLIKIRVLRPFPVKILADKLSKVKAVGVVDRDLSPGEGGIIFPEVRSALYESKSRPVISCFITGLGGKEVPFEEFKYMFDVLDKTIETGKGVVEIIETEHDQRLVKKMLEEALGNEVQIY